MRPVRAGALRDRGVPVDHPGEDPPVNVHDHPIVEQLLRDAAPRAVAPLSRRETLTEGLVGVVLVAAIIALAVLTGAPMPGPLNLAVAVAAYVAARRVQFSVGAGGASPTQPVLVVMLLVLPPWVVAPAVVVAALLDRLPDYVSGRVHPGHAVLTPGDAWHALGPAVVLALAGSPQPDLDLWPLYLAAFGAQVVFDVVWSMLREWLASGVPPELQLRLLGFSVIVDVALAPVGLLAAVAIPGGVAPVLLVMPLLALLGVLGREREQRIAHTLSLSHAYRGTALLMGELLVADDEYTGGEHTHGVVTLALEVGTRLGLDPTEQRNLEFGALLHDIGKIRVPDAIINKPGPLTDEEWAIMKRHPADGQQMLDRIGGVLGEVGLIVRGHHERWDGRGYPDGLVGEEIPLAARIICASDAFSAMTTNRSYRRAMSLDDAIAELRTCAGEQFDPAVVEAVVAVVGRRGSAPSLTLVA
jgi:HD-GYP domain-containing protein (c-di-GMP phosphodiesterase class II)